MKTDFMQLRVQVDEKETFEQAASLAGLPLSAWVRERLRRAARIELARIIHGGVGFWEVSGD
jgi:uncharacterized protein (DUF1778 family)